MKVGTRKPWQQILARRTAAALATLSLISAAHAEVQPNGTYGSSYGEWSANWWGWVLSIPADKNPNLDTSGANCGEGQYGNVWFLAGTFGGTVQRSCTIPAGKAILFPLINNLTFSPKGNETILDLRHSAASLIDGVTQLKCTLDGVACASNLSEFRAQSPVFKTIVRTQSLLPAKTYDPMVSDGYWVLLNPLSPGEHTLNFGATASGGFSVDITYTLTVLP